MATICIDEGAVCRPNLLEVVGGKLRARPAVAVFRASRPEQAMPTITAGGRSGVFETPIPFSDIDEDTTPGMFDLDGDGRVQVTCAGIYAVKVRYGSGGSTEQQVGGFIRWTKDSVQLLGIEFIDLNLVIQLGSSAEGPEFEASCAGVSLNAGELIGPTGRIYTAASDATVLVAGQIQVVYLGEAL